MQITSSSESECRSPLAFRFQRARQFRFQATRKRLFALLVILTLAGLASPQAQAQDAPQSKRLASVRASELPNGSRVTLVSDGSLSDYKTYTAANRFHVLLPHTGGLPAATALQGRGFSDTKIERNGEDLLLSFALEPATIASVSQKFNRLDVIFNVAGAAQAPPQQTASIAITTSDAVPSPQQESVKAAVKVGSIELPPEKAQPIRVPKFDKPPVLDGKLNEDEWKQAIVLKDFYQIQPGDNLAPSKPTEVLLGYDAKNLYIAFRAFDEPDKVRSTVAKRDNIFSDDYVGFFLDTFNDQRKAFEIFFNPLGVQGDGVITEGRGEDFSVDLLLDSKGQINEQGYVVEISIPFKSLRYEAGKGKLWGAHFFRRIKRFNNELDSWMPFSRSIGNDLSQAGHLTGLEGILTERTIELIPSLTLSETARRVGSFSTAPGVIDGGRMVNEPVKFDPGLTGKFGISPTVTLDFTLNPDFAQVEADQLVVTTNQRFPIFFEEKRPFFLEGIDIFRTNLLPVHTRAIVDPDAAVKLTGKKGRDTFGIMLASDNGPGNLSADDRGRLNACLEGQTLDLQANRIVSSPCRNDNIVDKNAYIGVLRLKHDVGKSDSTIGMLATTYNFIEKHNQLGGFDGRFRLNKQTVFDFQALGTTSRNFFYDPDTDRNTYRTGNGFAYATTYDVTGRNWGWQLYGEGYTQDYRADVGFVGRVNSNFNSFYVRHNTDAKPKGFLLRRHVHNFTHFDYDWQGRLYTWESEFNTELTLPRNSYLGIGYEYAYERLFEGEFGPRRRAPTPGDPGQDGAFYGEDNERSSSKNHYFLYGGSQFNKKYQFDFNLAYRDGHFDLDFGGGDRYPRVSPAALLLGQNAPLDPGPGNLLQFSGGITYQPTNLLRMSLNLIKQRLVRHDTGLVAFDVNIFTYRATYQFTRATFARAIIDYNTLNSRARGQFLLGWTPSPGTAFYAGYNDDINYGGFSPINGQLEPGFRRNGRTLFIKMAYLFRRSFGAK
jgi:Domain of unknown function (DUF5916)/Carbohydrate family 9 binding domain-like